MADIETTLKTRTNQDNVFPNIHTANIPDGGVTTAKMTSGAVTTSKIADSNVTTAKLANGAVTTAKIADSNVTTAKLADGAVTRGKIALGAIGYNQIEDGAVSGDKIPDESISGSKLAEDSISMGCFTTSRISFYDLIENYGSSDFLNYIAPELVRAQAMRLCVELSSGGVYYIASLNYIRVVKGQRLTLQYWDHFNNDNYTVDYQLNDLTPDSLKDVFAYYIDGAF